MHEHKYIITIQSINCKLLPMVAFNIQFFFVIIKYMNHAIIREKKVSYIYLNPLEINIADDASFLMCKVDVSLFIFHLHHWYIINIQIYEWQASYSMQPLILVMLVGCLNALNDTTSSSFMDVHHVISNPSAQMQGHLCRVCWLNLMYSM